MSNQQETVQKAIMLLRAEAAENEHRVSDFRQFAEQLQALADITCERSIERK